MAFDAQGQLFATENSGDRDDNEELNHLVEGGHYGFPWRIGTTDTPQQFPGYDPASDLLLNPSAGAVMDGHFHDDPTFPEAPPGVGFTDPIQNFGPDADKYRDPGTGVILDASDEGIPFSTFTSHLSPLGLVFDTEGALPGELSGHGLVLTWTGSASSLRGPYTGEGEDLLHLEFEPQRETSSIHATRLVRGFVNPIDAVLVENRLYVLEFGGGERVWELTFGEPVNAESEIPSVDYFLDLYPNPAADHARLSMVVQRRQYLDISLYSIHGQLVRNVFSGTLEAGQRLDRTLSTDGLASGVYVLVTRGSGSFDARTFVIMNGKIGRAHV